MSCYGIDAKPCNEQCHECERGDLDEIVEPNGYSQRKQCFQGLPVRSSDTVTEKVEYFVKRIESQNQPGPPNSGIPIPPNMNSVFRGIFSKRPVTWIAMTIFGRAMALFRVL